MYAKHMAWSRWSRHGESHGDGNNDDGANDDDDKRITMLQVT